MFSLPFAFAFGAGFVALASPCGIAMLPAYIGYYMGAREEGYEQTPIVLRFARALSIGGTASLAFLVLFGSFGLAWAAVGSVLREVIPGAAMVIGASLMVLGAYILITRRPIPFVPTIGVNWGTGSRGYVSVFLFGLAYALATLSCTFPIFLAVMGNALTLGGAGAVVTQFLVYGAGMGVGLIGLTLGAAVFKDLVRSFIRRAMPIVERASGAILMFAGGYIMWYWWINWFALNANL